MAQVLMVGGGGTDTSGVTAIASHVLNPDVFVNSDGQEVTGTMVDNSDTDFKLEELGEGWIPYLTSTPNGRLVVKVPSSGYYKQWTDAGGLGGVNRFSWPASYLGNAQASHVLATATFTSRYGIGQTGSIPSKAAETKHPVLTNMTDKVNITIAAGQYLSGAQVIRGVTISDTWTAANIKSGVKISVGDTSSVEALSVRTGTYTNVSSGQLALIASALRTGYSGYANGGAEVRGSMASYTTPTAFTPSQSPITIQVGGKYVSSNLTINAITYPSTFAAGNIKKGVTISIGGKSYTGTFEGFVPDTNDVYKKGTWGTNYSSNSMMAFINSNLTSKLTYDPSIIVWSGTTGVNSSGTVFYAPITYLANFNANLYSAFNIEYVSRAAANGHAETCYLFVSNQFTPTSSWYTLSYVPSSGNVYYKTSSSAAQVTVTVPAAQRASLATAAGTTSVRKISISLSGLTASNFRWYFCRSNYNATMAAYGDVEIQRIYFT